MEVSPPTASSLAGSGISAHEIPEPAAAIIRTERLLPRLTAERQEIEDKVGTSLEWNPSPENDQVIGTNKMLTYQIANAGKNTSGGRLT